MIFTLPILAKGNETQKRHFRSKQNVDRRVR